MKMRNIYSVGKHCFSLKTDSAPIIGLLDSMDNYKPFVFDADDNTSYVFELEIKYIDNLDNQKDGIKQLAEFDDDIAYISVMTDDEENNIFHISLNKELSNQGGFLLVKNMKRTAVLLLNERAELYHQRFIVNNAIMLLYAMFTAISGTLLIHSSVVSNEGYGYAFLGRSGTGKSTHTRLWLKYIGGSILLNDDNPVVRIHVDGKVMIYGSPWSGKTPCYRNEGVELKSIVRLSQAPYNKINRLHGVLAYAAVSPSASSMKWDRAIADGLHKTFSELIKAVGVYHLECLPDEEAARLSFNTIK